MLPVIEKFGKGEKEKEKVEKGKFYDSYYYDCKGQEEEADYRKMQTKMGFWEWPEWSIVLISVFFSVFAAIYMFVVCVLVVLFMKTLRTRRRLHGGIGTIWAGRV